MTFYQSREIIEIAQISSHNLNSYKIKTISESKNYLSNDYQTNELINLTSNTLEESTRAALEQCANQIRAFCQENNLSWKVNYTRSTTEKRISLNNLEKETKFIRSSAYLDIFLPKSQDKIWRQYSIGNRITNLNTQEQEEITSSLIREIRKSFPLTVKKEAKKIKRGKYTIHLPAGAGGILIHEALGHLLEAREDSILHQKLGMRIMPSNFNIIDDPTLFNGFGSFEFDDEGNSAKKTVLVKDGKINSYLTNKHTAEKFNLPLTHSARIGSSKFNSHPRMSNTFLEIQANSTMSNNLDKLDQDIASIEIEDIVGGKVNHKTGECIFYIRHAKLLQDENIIDLLPFYIRGNALEILGNIVNATGETELYASYCLGRSGSIPVSYGQPALTIVNAPCMPEG